MVAAPLILNRYRLLETLGKGGFGTVDVAWDSRLQRRVAIKRIPLSVDETDLPGIQEARTAALLNEPHIVSVIDFEVTGTEALLIMEHVDGPTLGDLLRESPDLLDLDTIATIVADVSAALEYAHENQVLHLDIKPDNILLDHKGQIKVTDFGLSELSSTAGFAEPQGGTIGYMPPEQIERGDIDKRTDLWAFAVLIYQLLTGLSPFNAPGTQESLERILYEPLQLPSALRDDLDPTIDGVLIKALLALKEQRYLSINELVNALNPLLGSAADGRKNLKFLINRRDLDEVEYSDDWHGEDTPVDQGELLIPASVPLWDRLPERLRGILGRLTAALACGSFGFLGLSGFELVSQANLQFLVLVGIITLIALGAFIVPQLGSAVASIVLIAGIFARGLIIVGIVLTIILVLWWLFCGRRGGAEAIVVMLTPLLGALWLGLAAPLLAGFFLPWRRAALAAVVQGLLLIMIAAACGDATIGHTSLFLPEQDGFMPAVFLAFLAQPYPWIALVAFILAALLMALLKGRDTRWAMALGILLAALVLMAAFIIAPMLINTDILLANLAQDAVGLALSFILLLLLSLLGVSARTLLTEEV